MCVREMLGMSVVLTDSNWLDLDTLLEVCVGGIIIISSWEDLPVAEGIDESGSSCQLLRISLSKQRGYKAYQSQMRRRQQCRIGFPFGLLAHNPHLAAGGSILLDILLLTEPDLGGLKISFTIAAVESFR